MADDKFMDDGYNEVSTRIIEFREKHPEGFFRTRFVDVPPPFNERFIAVEASIYRKPGEEPTGVDMAWEPVPGKTPFTKDSELMNASTSAVGRALIYALAADARSGVASADEVRNRQGGGKKPPSEGQLDFFESLIKGLVPDIETVMDYAQTELTGGKQGTMSKAIDGLKTAETKGEIAERIEKAAAEWKVKQANDEKAGE